MGKDTGSCAGLLMYRRREGRLEVLLAHPGGPYWARRDLGAWSLPKGLAEPDECLEDAAQREFTEETGFVPSGPFLPLSEVMQGKKRIHAWAFQGDCDPAQTRSNTFTQEWPPKSGKFVEFPEIDRTCFFSIEEAHRRLLHAQRPFLDRLVAALGDRAAIDRTPPQGAESNPKRA
jgi:predicted NUDIX family NTP pyrophosphohydrolase